MKAPTITDVAKQAGVSAATVSHVINGTRFVSDDTVAKVHAAIKILDFVPNASARSFKTGKHNLIGVIVPDISNSYFSAIIEEVESVVQKHGYNLIISNTHETRHREIQQLRMLSSGVVDGIILASTHETFSEVAPYIPEHFPLILLDRSLKNSAVDSLLVTDKDSIFQGVQFLASAGHKRIGFISGLQRLSTTVERLNAYLYGLDYCGIPRDASIIKYADSMAQSAYHFTQELVELGCSAIIIGNGLMTMAAINYVQHHISKGGNSIQILGYRYNDWDSWLPYLASIVQPDRDLGYAAGEQILRRIKRPDAPVQTIMFSSYLAQK